MKSCTFGWFIIALHMDIYLYSVWSFKKGKWWQDFGSDTKNRDFIVKFLTRSRDSYLPGTLMLLLDVCLLVASLHPLFLQNYFNNHFLPLSHELFICTALLFIEICGNSCNCFDLKAESLPELCKYPSTVFLLTVVLVVIEAIGLKNEWILLPFYCY